MISRRYSEYIKPAFFTWDLVLLNFTYILSYYLRFGDLHRITKVESQVILLFTNLLWIFLVSQYKAYKIIRIGQTETIILRAIKIIITHSILIFAFLLILKFQEISRLRLFYFYSIFFLLVIFFRIVFIITLKYLRKHGYNYRTVVIVGLNNPGIQMHSYLSKDLSLGYKIIGFFSDNTTENSQGYTILGDISEVTTYVAENSIDEVYISSLNYSTETIKNIINACEANLTRVKIIPEFNKYTKSRKVSIDFYGNLPIVLLRNEPLNDIKNQITKRFFDICFSTLFLLLIASWLFPILMIIVKFSSKGPIFFKQERSGENNKTFWCYKFRTMQVNDEAHIKQASKKDKRITKIGKCFRKYNIDELPQFLNVLKGDMSIVGPRPHMLKHTDEYSVLIKNYLVRHYIKPGVTGWAQINGLRGETIKVELMEKRVEFDIWYIENWTFLLDVRIVFKTIYNAFRGEENAG